MSDDIGGSGYSLDDLSAYHDRGRTPAIAAIDGNAECQAVLASLDRFGRLSVAIVEADAAAHPLDDDWFRGLMANVTRELKAGRDIPYPGADPNVELAITEGAVRELVRAAGDGIDGVLVGRTALRGDIADQDAEVTVELGISVVFRTPLPDVTRAVRGAVHSALLAHTPLRVGSIDITVDDIHLPAAAGGLT